MAPDEKPYRVYRGGRAKGKVPSPATRPRQERKARASDDGNGYRGPGAPPRRTGLRRIGWKRALVVGVLLLVALVGAWAAFGYLAVRSGVADANERLSQEARAQLAQTDGLLLSNPTTILLLGTDTSNLGGREGNRHADSIMLVRTDPSKHRISYLSLPRDLLVPVPGLGNAKINASFQAGGPALAIRTVRELTGVPIEHVVVVDFGSFRELVDAVGGVDIDVPKPILSNKFDCPKKTEEQCRRWEGWRFGKGSQHMDGRRALIYSRIRQNRLDPRETDLNRAARQQAVMQATTSKLTSPWTLARLPFSGDEMLKPLATDLSTGDILQLGWVKKRASAGNVLYCRLGGDPTTSGGQSVIIPSEDNRGAVAMWRGASAPQPPSSPYGPGCVKGRPLR
jgi:LCP family protein required for cell wall assembly